MAMQQQLESGRDMRFIRAVFRKLLVPSCSVCSRTALVVRRPMPATWWPTPDCPLSAEGLPILVRVSGEPMSWEAP